MPRGAAPTRVIRGKSHMRKWLKVAMLSILAVLTMAVFVGVSVYDGGQRATRLQASAHDRLALCELMAAQAGGSRDECLVPFRDALDSRLSRMGLTAALPMAIGAVALLWVLVGLGYILRRRRRTEVAAGQISSCTMSISRTRRFWRAVSTRRRSCSRRVLGLLDVAHDEVAGARGLVARGERDRADPGHLVEQARNRSARP